MAEETKQKGLFSSLSLGRAARTPRQPSETLTHPLLGASSSSLHLPPADVSASGDKTSATGPTAHTRTESYTRAELMGLPYKPRQRHSARDSAGSMNSVIGGGAAGPSSISPNLAPTSTTAAPGTSPNTPNSGIAAPPTLSTSTSTTFALPPSASDPQVAIETQHATAGPSSGSATTRLQQQSIKATAQRIGLGNGTMGMAMIDSVFEKCQLGKGKMAEGGDWADVIKVLTAGKAALLLPTAPASSLPVTPQILRDHIVFVVSPDATARRSSKGKEAEHGDFDHQFCTILSLSGMLGTMRGNKISFESILPPGSALMQAIRDTALRQVAISTLRPTTTSLGSGPYPTYDISSDTATLPFPPINKASLDESSGTKEKDTQKDKAAPAKFGRINPFASFFGANSNAGSSPNSSAALSSSPSHGGTGSVTPERPSSPSNLTSPGHASVPLSPRPSLLSMELSDAASIRSQDQHEGFQVTAYTVSRPIRYSEMQKSIAKAVRSSIRDELSRLPDKVVERVIKLITPGVCPMTPNTSTQDSAKNQHTETDAALHIDFTDPTTTGEKLQDLVESVYDDVMAQLRAEDSKSSALRRKTSGNLPWAKGESAENEKDRLTKEEHMEKDASEAAERVEGLICRMLYNRLFSPIESDDARHDEVLASRIAALNMLDLSLDHLGLITQPDEVDPDIEDRHSIQNGLRDVVEQIGQEFQKLSSTSCLTPKDKAEVLIRAHKIVVDGLSRLPPIQLRPEGEPFKPSSSDEGPDASDITISRISSNTPSTPTELRDMSPSDPDATPLPTEPYDNPLERTPSALGPREDSAVPQLTLTHSGDSPETSMLEEAMSDSVMTIQAPEDSSVTADLPAPSPAKASTSGADLILPIIIYAVVKANPAQLASHLMYLRRYRSAICLTGEASYAIVNLTAVIEFLEHVDMVELGLGEESDKVISVEDLSPIGLTYLDESNADAASIVSASSRLRGRVFQVTELAGSAADSANKVITGVVDSSWTALRGLIGPSADQQQQQLSPEGSAATVPRPNMRPRQASSFSLASVTASVASIAAAASTAAARSRSRATSRASDTQQHWTGNQEMIDVSSRPESIHEQEPDEDDNDLEPTISLERTESKGLELERDKDRSDVRSIRSISSMMSKEDSSGGNKNERATISNRLASIGVLGRLGNASTTDEFGGQSADASPSKTGNGLLSTLASGRVRGASLFGGGDVTRSSSVDKSSSTSSPPEPSDPPMERFMTCDVGDIKLSEIGPLLRDYRRLAGIIEAMQHTS